MPWVVVAGALIISVTIGFAFFLGTPILGVPIALALFGVIGLMELRRRHREQTDVRRFRGEAASQKTAFTSRDRETQVTEERV